MLLLYCANAVVLATHTDAQGVDKTLYGTGVRVIPWRGAIGDLVKVGAAPPAGFSDMRPYAQPTETPPILLDYAAQVRYETSVQPLQFTAASGVIAVKTDRISQSLLNNLASYAATLQPTDPVSFTQDTIHYAITAQEAIDMFNAVVAQVQHARDVEATCITDLKSPTPTILTYDDVDAAFATLRAAKDQPASEA